MIKIISHTVKVKDSNMTPEKMANLLKAIPGNLTAFPSTSSHKLDEPDQVTCYSEFNEEFKTKELMVGFRFAWISNGEFDYFKSLK